MLILTHCRVTHQANKRAKNALIHKVVKQIDKADVLIVSNPLIEADKQK